MRVIVAARSSTSLVLSLKNLAGFNHQNTGEGKEDQDFWVLALVIQHCLSGQILISGSTSLPNLSSLSKSIEANICVKGF